MNRRLIIASFAIAAVPFLAPAAFPTVPTADAAESVFQRSLRERLERFCVTPLAKRRPAACRRLASMSSTSSSSSSAGPIIRPPSSSSSSLSSSSSSRSSSSSLQPGYDTRSAEPVRSRLELLGTTTSTLAVARFTSLTEPITAESVTINLAQAAASLETIQVYNLDGRLLGTASRDSNTPTMYRANIPTGAFMIDKGKDGSLYVRGILRPRDGGGVSGELVAVDSITMRSTGDWSTESYTVTTTDTVPDSQTARAAITAVSTNNAGTWPLTTGSNQILWDFNVSGVHGDGEAVLRLKNLAFTLSQANVTLTNVRLQVADGDASVPCTVTSNQVLCDTIPSNIGTVPRDSALRLRVYADVAVNGTPLLAYVQLSLGEAGYPGSAGVVTWTDGTTTFQWVALESPLGVGPRFNQ